MSLLSKLKRALHRWILRDPSIGMERPQPKTVQEGARDLVERSRAGDQNAMAIICQVRDAAKSGDVNAKRGYQALAQYIKQNPPNKAQFGEELIADEMANALLQQLGDDNYVQVVREMAPELGAKSLAKASVTLANGPIIEQKLVQLRDSFEGEDVQKAFSLGAVDCKLCNTHDLTPECRDAMMLGYILGIAHRIQRVRQPGVPISILSPEAGWELGES